MSDSTSDSISQRIISLYNQYKNTDSTPTDRQLDLITKLTNTASKSGSSLNLTTIDSIFDAQKQIRFLLGNQPITQRQKDWIKTFPKDQVDAVLKRNVIIDDLTRFELSRIVNVLKFRDNLNPKVYNHPIISTPIYEYGWQESNICPDNKLYYLVFYDLLMVDIDNNDLVPSLNNAQLITPDSTSNYINNLDIQLKLYGLTARVYQTYNGYHIFITSHNINHKSLEAQRLMAALHCDIYYMTFSYLNGFKVRLNPKMRDDEYIAANYIATIGCQNEDNELVKLLTLHDDLILKHKR